MRMLLIGGNGFIGSPLTRELRRSGHHIAVLHRRVAPDPTDPDLVRIQADRNRLSRYRSEILRFSPDVIVDLILSSAEQAQQLMDISRDIARRVIALSTMDVYRAWGLMQGVEKGAPDPLPLTEDSPRRTVRQLYPPATVKTLQNVFTWVDERYDKIAVEDAILGDPAIPGTVLRLPMVYGPGDHLHRFFPLLKRLADHRASILLPDDFAAWRGPRGYVENVAHGIALAATSDQAAGRVYNVCDEPSLSELAWQTAIARQMKWPGNFVVLPREHTPAHLVLPGNAAQHIVASSARIRSELGYKEPVGIEEAIRRTAAWELQNPPSTIDARQFDYAAEDAALAERP